MATARQLQALAMIRRERYGTRDKWFAMVEFEIGVKIDSNRELTFGQASHLLTVMTAVGA
jgi:hypothetical protein